MRGSRIRVGSTRGSSACKTVPFSFGYKTLFFVFSFFDFSFCFFFDFLERETLVSLYLRRPPVAWFRHGYRRRCRSTPCSGAFFGQKGRRLTDRNLLVPDLTSFWPKYCSFYTNLKNKIRKKIIFPLFYYSFSGAVGSSLRTVVWFVRGLFLESRGSCEGLRVRVFCGSGLFLVSFLSLRSKMAGVKGCILRV